MKPRFPIARTARFRSKLVWRGLDAGRLIYWSTAYIRSFMQPEAPRPPMRPITRWARH